MQNVVGINKDSWHTGMSLCPYPECPKESGKPVDSPGVCMGALIKVIVTL